MRAPYLEPLVNYLKNSNILNGHGISGVPDLNGQNIFPFADWNDDTDSASYGPFLVIIEPGTSENLNSNQERTDCKNEFEHEIIIRVQAINKRNTDQALQESQTGNVTTYTGAFIDAQKLEDLVRATILAFNSTINFDAGYSPLFLKDMPKQESIDGWIILPQIYTTRIMF